MSVLTKVFVILVTLLSVALVAAMVPFVANTESWRHKFEEAESQRRASDTTAAARQQQLDAERSNRQEELVGWHEQIEDLEDQIKVQRDDVTTLQATIKGKDLDISQLNASDTQLRMINESHARTIEAQTEELRDRRKNMLEQATHLIQIEQRNQELETDNDFLGLKLRRFREEIVALQEVRETLEKMLERIPKDIRAPYIADETLEVIDPPHPIEGRVDRVQDLGEDTFVQINVGDADGVARGMQFYVHRGEQYVGTMIVTTVEEHSSAGTMKLVKLPVTPNDGVSAHPAQ